MLSSRKGLLLLLPQTIRTNRVNYFYNKYKGVNRDWLAKLQQPIRINPEGMINWVMRKNKWDSIFEGDSETLKRYPKCDLKKIQTLGPDIAFAHFVVMNGGAIQFKGTKRWVEKDKEGKYVLPVAKVPDLFVQAVDCSNMNITYDSFDYFNNLEKLKYLNLSGCPYIDDWCMDRMIMFKNTLVHLDVSGCPRLSERGLTALHKLSKLQVLEMGNMPSVQQPTLFALMLEEVLPLCEVKGVDRSEETVTLETEPPTPAFIKHFLKQADSGDNTEDSGDYSSESGNSTNVLSSKDFQPNKASNQESSTSIS